MMKTARNDAILAAVLGGRTMTDVAREHDISCQRVGQIVRPRLSAVEQRRVRERGVASMAAGHRKPPVVLKCAVCDEEITTIPSRAKTAFVCSVECWARCRRFPDDRVREAERLRREGRTWKEVARTVFNTQGAVVQQAVARLQREEGRVDPTIFGVTGRRYLGLL